MFFILCFVLPFMFVLLGTFAVIIAVGILFQFRFSWLERLLYLLLLLRCFMFFYPPTVLVANQYYVCGEVFMNRTYDFVRLCNQTSTFIAYFPEDSQLQYLDTVWLSDSRHIKKQEKLGYYLSMNVDGELKFSSFEILESRTSGLRKLYSFKTRFKAYVQENLNEPFSNLFLGILMGDRAGYSKDLVQDLSFVGLTHLVAVSGMNVSLVLYVFSSLTWVFGKRTAFLLNVLFVILFAYFTSLSTSVLRACLMAIIYLWADFCHEKLCEFRVLYFSAYVLLLLNPASIVYDLAFMLSYAATFALISIKKTERLSFEFAKEIKANLASFWFTAPIILFYFNKLPLLTVISNLLVMYPATFLLYLGMGVLFFYSVKIDFINFLLFFCVDVLCFYFFAIVDITKAFPVMTLTIESLVLKIGILLLLLMVFILLLRKHFRFA